MQGMMMMEYSEERTANAVGGKTARACENCLRKRARWFCSADDAFLCQACDKSVHSANNLASRHERVRLETSSSSSSSTPSSSSKSKPPVWHQGFTRKPRTPRHNNNNNNNKNKKKGIHVNSLPLVPEIGGEDEEDEEEEFLYRVPEFDLTGAKELNFLLDGEDDAELAEFAADVESLLNDDTDNNKISSVKIENDDEEEDDESFSWDDYFDYSAASPAIHIINNKQDEEDIVKKEEMMMTTTINNGNLLETKEEEEEEEEGSRKISLKLNYEEVMNAWDNNTLQLHQPACPWLNGIRPDFNPSHNSWPDFLLLEKGWGESEQYAGAYGVGGGGGCRNEEREARVLRYREKRRTRLFSKKIRYEVRKLNAEKRPRMKGRFVKRTNTTTTATPSSSSTTTFPINY